MVIGAAVRRSPMKVYTKYLYFIFILYFLY